MWKLFCIVDKVKAEKALLHQWDPKVPFAGCNICGQLVKRGKYLQNWQVKQSIVSLTSHLESKAHGNKGVTGLVSEVDRVLSPEEKKRKVQHTLAGFHQ